MRCRNAVVIALLAVGAAYADPPRREVVDANNLVKSGRTEAALQSYRSMQVDEPESDLLYYNIGCAQLEAASKADTPEDMVAAEDDLSEAYESFEKAAMAEDPDIRRDARYNRVNVTSRLAKNLAASNEYKRAVAEYENAIRGYEDFLEQYPGHAGAQKNLDHMRYLLKKMLQDPPPPEEQEPPDAEEGEGEQEPQEQEGEQSGDQQQQDEQQQPDQSDDAQENEEQQDGDAQPQPEQQPEDQDESTEPRTGDEQSGEMSSGTDSTTENAEPEPLPDRETIEAILDALAERDEQEQKDMRRVPQNPRSTGPWW